MQNGRAKSKILQTLILVSSLFFLVPAQVKAQVVINEFNSGTTSDWVELYNISTQSANLSSYKLMDSGSNDKILSGEIAPGGFVSFNFSNWLNNDGDTVRLFKADVLVDSISYGGNSQVCLAGNGESIGRYPDGNSTIERFLTPTRDLSNNSATLNPCPTPTSTPTPTPTPAPTASPTPTPTTAPTKTPTPSPTKSPTPKPASTPEESATPQSLVLGLRGETASPLAMSKPETKKKFPLLSFILIFSGLVFLGGAGFLVFKIQKEGYNNGSGEIPKNS